MLGGRSCRETARLFVVNVTKWSQRQRAVGNPAARSVGGRRRRARLDEQGWILSRLAEEAYLTVQALTAEFKKRRLAISPSTR